MKRERQKVVMFEKNHNVRIGLSYSFEPELNKTKKKKNGRENKTTKKNVVLKILIMSRLTQNSRRPHATRC